MRNPKIATSFALALLISTVVWSASLEEARRLFEADDVAAALTEIHAVLDSGATVAEKADALDLLGTIAVDQGQLAMAEQAWRQLLDEYPDAAAARDAATKLQLVSALLKTEAPAAEASPAATITPEPVAETPAPVSDAAPPSAPPPSAPPPTTRPVTSARVLVAARGKPYDAVMEASDRLVTFLRENGVDAESATGGIPVVEDSNMVLPLLLQKGQQEEVGSVLLLTADFLTMQKMSLDCYRPAGEKVWKVKISGGTGWKGRPYSKTGLTEDLYTRFEEKVAAKVGDPGLPVSLE